MHDLPKNTAWIYPPSTMEWHGLGWDCESGFFFLNDSVEKLQMQNLYCTQIAAEVAYKTFKSYKY